MIERWTSWTSEDTGEVQVSLALLTDRWEPCTEATMAVGPFDSPADVRDQLRASVDRFVRTYGIPLELW